MKTFIKDVRRNFPLLMLTAPVVIYLLMFNYIPMYGITIAFKNFNYRKGIMGSDWTGFKNFEFLFKSGDAFTIIRNTLLYNIVFIITGILLAIILAILFDALGKKLLNRINQTVVIMPHFLSMVIVSYFVYSFLSTDKGILNQTLTALGLSGVDWYTEPVFWPFILWIVNCWSTLGWNSIVYYATIKGFDTEYYEAARVDGATWLQQVRYITFPLLKPTIIVLMIMSIGHIFSSGIDLYYLIPRNSGALYSVTNTVDTYVYRGLIQNGNIGMTSATSVLQSVVGFVLVVSVNQIIRKISPEDSMF